MGTLPKVLLVDDNADSLFTLTAILEGEDRELLTAQSGPDALRFVLDHDFAAIVMDVRMPGMDGFETASIIRARKRSESTPILFLTGFRDDDHLVRGYSLRAVDFLFKPVASEVLISKISTFVTLAKQADEIKALNSELERKVDERTVALRAAIQDAKAARVEADAANEAKTKFVTHLSHELRTPLNAVIGYAEMLLEDASDRGLANLIPDVRRIRNAAGHLSSLIDDVLDLSKIEAGRMDLNLARFDIRPLLDEVVATANPLIARRANRLQVSLSGEVGSMRSDPTRIRQCLLNLLANAARFTENGVISLSVMEDGGQIRFSVRDTGIGMSPAQLGCLFQPFSQVHGPLSAGGTGLGLVITQRFCQLLGGGICVESEVGTGTVFTMSLPANIGEPSPIAAA